MASTASGMVNLSCGALPAESTCAFSPAQVSGAGIVTLTVSTQAPTLSRIPQQRKESGLPVYTALLPMLGLAGVTFGVRRNAARKVIGLVGMACLLVLAGCGGGSSTPPPPGPQGGTPPGTYTITMTANNATANLSGSLSVTLTVK